MTTQANPIDSATAKLIAIVLVLAFLAVGLAGLLLPIIPGLLFLAIAAVIAAKHLPALERALRRNATLGGYLDTADGFVGLPFWKKVQLGALLCLKMLIDGVAFVVVAAARLFKQRAGGR
jgi:uncharacterized membrane protein YbaN (DUF454 family)